MYAQVDVRGSRYHGNNVLHEAYNQIGKVEVEDYIDVVNYLKSKLSYIDGNKVAIWGWSYGGYVALSTLIHDRADKMFSCGVAIAPITNWLLVGKFLITMVKV